MLNSMQCILQYRTLSPHLARENSFLTMRNRAKSMDGGMLRPSAANPNRGSTPLQYQSSSLNSRFRPPQDYNVLHWLAARLNKVRLRRRARGIENVHMARVKKCTQKIVEHRCVPTANTVEPVYSCHPLGPC